VLATPIVDRVSKLEHSVIEDPDVLLSVSERLRLQVEGKPADVREEAEFFYKFLQSPLRDIGTFDEREYFLGEFALLAGSACRLLFRRQESRRWFSRADASFVLCQNGGANVGRVAYQRLALLTEERELEEVTELASLWGRTLSGLGLKEESLKCQFLEGIALWERGELSLALECFETLRASCENIGSERLHAQATNNCGMIYAAMGRREEAIARSQEALPLFQKLNDRVGIVKLQWGMGTLLRGQGKSNQAVDAYRAALREAESVGLRGDVAALHLVVADVLLEGGLEAQAEWEIRAALPIIDEERMVPEGMAALTLLRESLKRRQINRQALRELHGYFHESVS